MATTPNYGWVTPAPSDYVVDLPADFETFADAVDADLAGLLGGTTGQVLVKDSNADHDFSWVDPDDPNAIEAAILDAKGDLISATAADTPARLAVGTNGQVLTANSSTSTGLEWATPTSGGITLLSTTTLSGSSTTISSISGAYSKLWVMVYGINLSNTVAINFEFLNGATALDVQTVGIVTAPTGTIRQVTGTKIMLDANYGNDYLSANTANTFSVVIDDYASTTNFKPISGAGSYNISGPTNQAFGFQGAVRSNSAINSIKLYPVSGTFSAGTVKIYGVK